MDNMAKREATTGEMMEILEFLQEQMVTKEDLKGFATKEDLRGSNLSLKEEIHSLRLVTQEEFRQVREEMATKEDMREFRSEILTTLDAFAKAQETRDHEFVSLRSAYRRHEDRLEVVEQKLGLAE